MPAEIVRGKPVAKRILGEAKKELEGLRAKVVAVHNAASAAAGYYMRQQKKTCAGAGVEYEVCEISGETGEEKILSRIAELNGDASVTGITVHTPLPDGVDADRVMRAIAPGKDIESIHPENLGLLAFGEHRPAPCAASGAVELARSIKPSFRGMEAVVVGRSALVGKAIALLLLQSRKEAPTPTICHTATPDLGAVTRRADLLFVAAGRAGLVRGEMIKPGAIVIDVGINETPDGKLVGDVIFDEAEKVAGYLTPVPGGVGPVCLAILLHNIAACAK